MSVGPETMKWLDWVSTTSIPLYRVDANDKPTGVASGCLVNIWQRKLLLSVSHATGVGQWVAEMRFDPAQDKTLLHYFGKQWTVQHLDQSASMQQELDFSFTETPADFFSLMQERGTGGEIVSERRRHAFDTTLEDLPTKEGVYAFTGRVRPEQLDELTFWSEPTVYPGLRYERTNGNYHIFSLPVPHPGHDAFQGCSGAPIVDCSGKVVALVCSGDIGSNTITGIAVQHLSRAIHAHLFTRA